MKKTIKFILKGLLGLIILTFLLYSGFRVREYFVGNKYVSYLEKNTLEQTPIADSLVLKFNDQFYNNNLFLVGELHEVATSPIIDVAMFIHLNEKVNITANIAEMDIAQAYYLNKYLNGSSTQNLETILKNWGVFIGQVSKAYRDGKWGKLKDYYQSLPDNKKFKVFGIDKISDFSLLHNLLNEKIPYAYQIPKDKEKLIKWGTANIPKILSNHDFGLNECQLLENIYFNLSNYKNIKYRDEFMFKNFKRFYKQNDWANNNLYGCFGFYHTLQGLQRTFAGRLRNSNQPNIKEKMVSINTINTNAHITVLSSYLPSFIADNTEYTRLSFSNDNTFDNYILGIEDFKRAGKKKSINLFQLNADEAPYNHSLRGISNFSLLPFAPSINIKNKNTATTDYFQYIFVVDGADWIQPD